MNFCSQCGQPVASEIPPGDTLERFVCQSCKTIHYQNPRLVVGCVPDCDGSILLCKRAIEPRRGYWTVPAGFMELGESLAEAAARETQEEALASVNLGPIIAIVDVIQAGQVHLFFEATMTEPVYGAGDESLETRLFPPEELPWEAIAFPSVTIALEQHLANRKSGVRELRLTTAPKISLS